MPFIKRKIKNVAGKGFFGFSLAADPGNGEFGRKKDFGMTNVECRMSKKCILSFLTKS
jgi:hypothetical protein